jgi:hypothetical protein
MAAGLCVALLAAGLGLLLPYLSRHPHQGKPKPPTLEEIEEHLGTGLKLLRQGKFHMSLDELNSALAMRLRAPGVLSAERGLELHQLHRQADLLSRLSPLPLEELVRQGRFVKAPDEWAAHWKAFRGRTVLFDDIVRRDDEGHPVFAGLVVQADGEQARLALEDIAALKDLPLDTSPRLIFGARLKSCLREEGGQCVIRFEPDSGVLLTDLAALEAACAVPLDEGAKAVMERQARWVEQFGPVAPAGP